MWLDSEDLSSSAPAGIYMNFTICFQKHLSLQYFMAVLIVTGLWFLLE